MGNQSNEWYFATGGTSREGPISRASLLALRHAEKLTDETLVWSNGMADWKPFAHVFPETLKSAPPPIPVSLSPSKEAPRYQTPAISASTAAPIADGSGTFLGGIQHPWRRLFARTVDVSTLGLLAFLALAFGIGYIFPEKAEGFIKASENQIIASFILLALWIPIESLLLSTVGSTPGKWLFGISVKTASGQKPSFGQAIERSFRVVIQGMGLGIPCVSLLTHLYAYRRLTKTGTTLWDTATQLAVSHKTWGAGRAIVCVITVFVVFMLLAVLNAAGK